METLAEKLSLNTEDGKMLQLCFAVVFFYNLSKDRERQKGILDILDEHTALVNDAYRWTQNPTTCKWKKLKQGINSYTLPREWVLTNPAYRWTLIYHAGEKASDASDKELYTFNLGDTPSADRTSFLRVHFPLTVLQDIPALVERMRRWSALIRPNHGYAGFCLGRSHGFERGYPVSQEYTLAQRFPGIDVYDHIQNCFQLGKFIKCVSWLTMLSTDFIDRIGGLQHVRERMGNLPVLEYEGGAMLQAGPMPQLGDNEQNLPMTDYEQVAAIVEPLRHKAYNGGAEALAPEPKFTDYSYREWLARFSPKQPG